MKKNCKHKSYYLQYLSKDFQYPYGVSGTTMAKEYAYFLCKCGEVIKKEIINL